MKLSETVQRIAVRVLENRPLGGSLRSLVLEAPEIASVVLPGQFVQLDCHPSLTLLRPFSIMNADSEKGTVEIFYQVVGVGTKVMEQWLPGQKTWVLGPLGSCFTVGNAGEQTLLVAGGVGLAPLRFLAHRLVKRHIPVTLLWGLEAEQIPFATAPAVRDAGVLVVENPLALVLEEEMGIVTRLASVTKREGFFHGYVSDLMNRVLEVVVGSGIRPRLYVCGPTPMMAQVADLAQRWGLQGEVSLESHMACGFGGCAGCVVPVSQGDGWRYVRSCTEGPVLPLEQVLWEVPMGNGGGCTIKGGT